MKKILLILIGSFLSLQCFAETLQEINGKFYVSPGAIYVAPNAIYLNVDGHFIPVKGISIDENGIYAEGFVTGQNTYCLRCKRWWNSDRHSPICPHY